MSWDAGELERLELKSFFGKAFDIVSVMFTSQQSVLLLLNMPRALSWSNGMDTTRTTTMSDVA
jgi:hypothetical protein